MILQEQLFARSNNVKIYVFDLEMCTPSLLISLYKEESKTSFLDMKFSKYMVIAVMIWRIVKKDMFLNAVQKNSTEI